MGRREGPDRLPPRQRPDVTVASAVREHTLYRFYDSAGVLLYVGITSSLPARIEHHRAVKEGGPRSHK